MDSSAPILASAKEREAGCVCPHCGGAVQEHDHIAICQGCGTVHHQACWHSQQRCGSYACAPARAAVDSKQAPAWVITAEDLSAAQPLPSRRPAFVPSLRSPPEPEGRPNRLALAAFITALAGIPFFGVLTGLVAILLGALALGTMRGGTQRGLGFALTGILLGLGDVVGWVVFLFVVLSQPGPAVSFEEFRNDPRVLENLDPVLARAMRATVMIDVHRGLLAGTAKGSGVILNVTAHDAVLVTNRHVVDSKFDGSDRREDIERLPPVRVHFIGPATIEGHVVWQAPGGVDLALVRVGGVPAEARDALWQRGRPLRIGDAVFAIGNPLGLGWTHTQGTVSQLRFQNMGGREVHVIQTQTAINPGNSGGGLFDRDGYLVGVNTWTKDKRISEGLNFAIALDTLLELNPPGLHATDSAGKEEKR
jgi:S1-C subfamily serine protease